MTTAKLSEAELKGIADYPPQALSWGTACEHRLQLLAHAKALIAELAEAKQRLAAAQQQPDLACQCDWCAPKDQSHYSPFHCKVARAYGRCSWARALRRTLQGGAWRLRIATRRSRPSGPASGGEVMERCGIKHKFGDQTCCREKGHDGLCRSKSERGGGTITYSEWESRDGKFYSHVGYRTIYPANAK